MYLRQGVDRCRRGRRWHQKLSLPGSEALMQSGPEDEQTAQRYPDLSNSRLLLSPVYC